MTTSSSCSSSSSYVPYPGYELLLQPYIDIPNDVIISHLFPNTALDWQQLHRVVAFAKYHIARGITYSSVVPVCEILPSCHPLNTSAVIFIKNEIPSFYFISETIQHCSNNKFFYIGYSIQSESIKKVLISFEANLQTHDTRLNTIFTSDYLNKPIFCLEFQNRLVTVFSDNQGSLHEIREKVFSFAIHEKMNLLLHLSKGLEELDHNNLFHSHLSFESLYVQSTTSAHQLLIGDLEWINNIPMQGQQIPLTPYLPPEAYIPIYSDLHPLEFWASHNFAILTLEILSGKDFRLFFPKDRILSTVEYYNMFHREIFSIIEPENAPNTHKFILKILIELLKKILLGAIDKRPSIQSINLLLKALIEFCSLSPTLVKDFICYVHLKTAYSKTLENLINLPELDAPSKDEIDFIQSHLNQKLSPNVLDSTLNFFKNYPFYLTLYLAEWKLNKQKQELTYTKV